LCHSALPYLAPRPLEGLSRFLFQCYSRPGYRFAPRIRDLADKRLAVIEKPTCYQALEGLIGTALNTKQITTHWDEILRLATSIRQGTVTASLMLRKLGAYPAQNGLALALRELGRARTLALHPGLSEGRGSPTTDPRRPEQGRGPERAGAGGVLQSPGRASRPDV